ncbi:beta-lactamase [Capronia epimyces CBS 606.96]|uniref:Beta-lactamase n=1 Tax=Capronia epimyces CBS 606.96 TaxID=1182542 RepID=W9YAD7_9EURO|nr:beta-lactamase [Capronia epimyces CBS 606.96]EXJ86615.1 beta-lactamase [Capronia epimyces CBS 606.96]
MTATVHGHADPAFQGLRTLMQELIESGEEDGASLVINVAGQNVVDLWGGYADAGRTQPWAQDTITNIWSSTKPVAALATLMLVDRQLLDLDAPVAQYWPEFGAEGKADVDVDVDVVLVKHLLAHTSGLSGWEQPFSVQDLYDWDTAVARLARQKPWWAPGSASGYHSLSYGHLLGELVRRVTGQSLRHFVRDHIAGPLQADLQIGAEEQDWSRIAPVVPPPPPQQPSPARPSTPVTRGRRSGAAANGHSNARGLARALSAITLGGTVDGVKLLSPQTIDRIFDIQADGTDLALGVPIRFGIGFGLTGGATAQAVDWLPAGRVCFWGGWGGSSIVMDLDRKVTFSYVMNKMGGGLLGSARTEAYLKAAYKALAVEGY